MHNSHTNL